MFNFNLKGRDYMAIKFLVYRQDGTTLEAVEIPPDPYDTTSMGGRSSIPSRLSIFELADGRALSSIDKEKNTFKILETGEVVKRHPGLKK